MRKPTPFQKKDGKWYCNHQGKQHYLGKSPEPKFSQLIKGHSIKSNSLKLSDVSSK